jgi:hypothetical protein
MNSDFSVSDSASTFFDAPLRKPSRILFLSGLISVLLGIALGLWGLKSVGTSSNAQEYEIGFLGYLFTALIPIILLQVIIGSHSKSLAKNHDQPYDIYAGNSNIANFKKIVLIGLIAASIPIWVFFYPIAEIYA